MVDDKDYARLHSLHQLIASELRDRVEAVRQQGHACSLFQAMLLLQLTTWEGDFHTLVEAIEDAEKL